MQMRDDDDTGSEDMRAAPDPQAAETDNSSVCSPESAGAVPAGVEAPIEVGL